MSRYRRFAERYFNNIAIRGSKEWMVSCTFHGGNDSLQFNIESGQWICFGCGKGGSISSLTDEDVPDYAPSLGSLRDRLETLKGRGTRLDVLPAEWLQQFNVGHDYWESRGLAERTVRRWGLGYDFSDDTVTIPLWTTDKQGVYGVIKRSLDPDALIRYRYPKGFVRRQYLYGEHDIEHESIVFVTEGSIDAIAASETGYGAVAVLGSSLSQVQLDRLMRLHPRHTVLAFDNDKAGREATDKAKLLLRGRSFSVIEWPGGIKDFGDLDKSERIELVEEHITSAKIAAC